MFDPIPPLEVLLKHKVRFVLIGGFAGRLWGSNSVTDDLDICYARDDKNLEALAGALRELHARLRGAPPDLPFILDGKTLKAGDHFTFMTKFGSVACLGSPKGSAGFPDLMRGAKEMLIGPLRVSVAALEDVIQMKRAAGRPKDLVEVEVLAALREEIERKRRDDR
jgi:hypothetical protein